MQTGVIERVKDSLVAQRQNLATWLRTTPAQKKQLRFGPAGEPAAEAHLQVLDAAIKKAESETLGMCEVCHEPVETELLEMDYTCCVCVEHLSGEERRRLESDLELSAKVQQALLPQQAPDIPGLQLAAFSQPARIVSGDYFDFFQFKDGSFGLVVGDVVDKGMAASLLMASLQASLRIIVPESSQPAEVAERLDDLFQHNVRLSQFVTLFLGRFDPKRRTLSYCNAGHNPPLLYRPSADETDAVRWLLPTGAAIGLIEGNQFETETVQLAPGDVLLLYTDGVTEARNPQGEEYGRARMLETARQTASMSARELVRGLRRQLQDFTSGQPPADDVTIVACKVQA